MVRSCLGALAALVLCALSFEAQAQAMTPAGTAIQNTAEVTYTVGTTTLTETSNTTTVTVLELLDVAVTVNSSTRIVTPGATQEELVFTVTNTGNGTETFSLAAASALAGDQFDPLPSATFIYFDNDSSGDLNAGDTPYAGGADDPVLTHTGAGSSVQVIVVNDIPSGLVSGDRGRSQLIASARTGTGAAGDVIGGQGDGGIDAVVGTTGADAEAFGEYLIEALQLSAVKSQVIADPFGKSLPVPGATITYRVVITPSGTGTANAVSFADAIPQHTTYVPGSLRLNTVVQNDSGGADAGEYTTTPAPRVTVDLGTLTGASGAQTIEFAVTIDDGTP